MPPNPQERRGIPLASPCSHTRAHLHQCPQRRTSTNEPTSASGWSLGVAPTAAISCRRRAMAHVRCVSGFNTSVWRSSNLATRPSKGCSHLATPRRTRPSSGIAPCEPCTREHRRPGVTQPPDRVLPSRVRPRDSRSCRGCTPPRSAIPPFPWGTGHSNTRVEPVLCRWRDGGGCRRWSSASSSAWRCRSSCR